MGGQFSVNALPPRPGAYFDFDAVTPAPTYVNSLGIIAVPFTHNWGPANKVVELDSFTDFLRFYGDGGASLVPAVYTDGYRAISGAFRGEDLPGRGGAGVVLAYRMVGSAGVGSSLTLQNTAPAGAITLTAKYPGTFGNNITAEVVANSRNPGTQTDLNIYVQGSLVETFTFNNTDITGLAAQINANSQWVTASSVTSGVALTTITPTALAGGNDGATLTGTDFTNMENAYGVQRFGVFAPSDIANTASWSDSTGSAVLTALLAWQKGLNANGKRFMTVIGGSLSDSASSAQARSALANDENVINIGLGQIADATLGTLSTSQLAPRLAGIIAARGDRMGLTFARLAGVSLISGATDADILAAIRGGGFMTLGRDSNAAAPIRFEKGLSTYTSDTTAKPRWVYSNPKFVLTMQDIENTITDWANANVIGQIPVDVKGVNFVLGAIKGFMKDWEAAEVIQTGWTVKRSTQPAPSPQDDFIAVTYGVSFMRDTEQVLNTVVVQ